MSRPRVQVTSHLSYTEIAERYETCCDDRIKTYWQTIRLLSQEEPYLSVEQVAEKVQISTDWVRKLVRRYNRLGPSGLTGQSQKEYRKRSRLHK